MAQCHHCNFYFGNFRFLKSAGGYNDWPNGRGIFFNNNKTFLVWANEEDHLRLISMQKGGNLAEVYARLVTVGFIFLNMESIEVFPTSYCSS